MTLPAFMRPRAVARTFARSRSPGGGGPPPGKPLPGFPLVQQDLDNWCWAAVASGVDKVRGRQRSQCQIAAGYAGVTQDPVVAAILGAGPCCPPTSSVDTIGYLNEVLDYLGLTRVPYSAVAGGGTTVAAARADLGNDRPVPIRIRWSARDDGHFIALVGSDSRGGVFTFLVYDPAENHADVGHLLYRTEQELAGSYDGIGQWSHIYPVK